MHCTTHGVHVPPVRVEPRAHAGGQHARHVLQQAAARDVRRRLHAPAAQRARHALRVDARRLDQLLT